MRLFCLMMLVACFSNATPGSIVVKTAVGMSCLVHAVSAMKHPTDKPKGGWNQEGDGWPMILPLILGALWMWFTGAPPV
jgi:hypothetical protein